MYATVKIFDSKEAALAYVAQHSERFRHVSYYYAPILVDGDKDGRKGQWRLVF